MTQTDTMRCASALSEAPSTAAALDAVLHELQAALAGPADLAVVFASPHHAAGFDLIQRRLADALHPRVALGATAEGVIGRRRELEDQPGLSIFAARTPGPGAALHPFADADIDWQAVGDSPAALRPFIQPREDQRPKAIVLLADPFSSTPRTKLLPMLNDAFPGVPVVGGMASGSQEPGGNRLLLGSHVYREGAVGVAIGAGVRIDCTVSQGCRAVGRPYVITKSKRHVVQELGGRNALQALQEVVAEATDADRELMQSHGLLVGRVINEYKDRFGRGDFLIRGILGLDRASGYFAINDSQVRVGQTVQFHVRDRQTAEEDFRLLLDAQKLHGPAAPGAAGALLFSCNGRGTRLFDRPDADAAIVHEALGDLPLAGFFAAGELGPIGGENFLHGHTASLAVFREEKGVSHR